jgi:hypothetical protein
MVKHPTSAWPPAPQRRSFSEPVEIDPPVVRRAPRPERQSPTVPWIYLISSTVILAVLIMLVVRERAELIRENNQLISYRSQRNKVLKERGELKISIQRLTSLERVDALVRKDLKMVRPAHRVVLDLSHYQAARPKVVHLARQPRAEEATQ